MKNFIENLKKPTPSNNILNWLVMTFLYTLTIFVNEQFSLIHDIGLSEKTESIIKMLGAFLYMLFTAISFSQTSGQKLVGDQPDDPRNDPKP